MLSVQQEVPLFAPLLFLGWGLLALFWLRDDLRDPDGALRRMAEQRVRSRLLRMMGGNTDPQREYEELRRGRWLFPVIILGYFGASLYGLGLALSQL